ncbi:SDR family NAD(P)-dependent oxidoreductase [Streptomyces sp. NBC_01520]|uniref:hypothetical protein n=1 Tax=Streptomyces sp. NBC_01520 TaxID=2903892 RepID=UPI0038645A5B
MTALGSGWPSAAEVSDEVGEHLMAVNVLAPAAFFRAALGIMRPGSVIAAVTGAVAERPRAGMADYSASKAALSTWPAPRATKCAPSASGCWTSGPDTWPPVSPTGRSRARPHRCPREETRTNSSVPSRTRWRRTLS